MDSSMTAAARALAAGDALGALKRVALRDDAPALALRGIAMAQLGDLAKARALLRDAARAFGLKESVARARCVVAEAEVALASRDLAFSAAKLDAARTTLAAHGDRINAEHARYLEARRLLLIGRVDATEQALANSKPDRLPAVLRAIHELTVAGIALRRMQPKVARAALSRSLSAAHDAAIPALTAEVEHAFRVLSAPVARTTMQDGERALTLDDVEALIASGTLIVDACRNVVRDAQQTISLATRPVLFTLTRMLANAAPHDVSRDRLIHRAFGLKRPDDSSRARLRVEIGRLRKSLERVARITATAEGFVLTPVRAKQLVVLARPVETEHADVLALLADGESWSSSALALALGSSQRSVQRALDTLAAAGKAQSFGRGRARRWATPPMFGFATTLLLPAPLPSD